jgi:hypothetical protein
MMIKQMRTVMGAAAAAAMVIGLGVAPVAAATATWTVTAGGSSTRSPIWRPPT